MGRPRSMARMMTKLNGEVADVHKILVSAAKLHEKGHTSWIVPGGGEIIPLNHPVSKAMIAAYHKAVDEFGKMGIIPVPQ